MVYVSVVVITNIGFFEFDSVLALSVQLCFFLLYLEQLLRIGFQHHFCSSEIYRVEVIHNKLLQLALVVSHLLVELSFLLVNALSLEKKYINQKCCVEWIFSEEISYWVFRFWDQLQASLLDRTRYYVWIHSRTSLSKQYEVSPSRLEEKSQTKSTIMQKKSC